MNYFNNLSLFVMFTNQLNQSTKNHQVEKKSLPKSLLTPFSISGILEGSENKESPNTICIKAFFAGPTRLELATSCVTGRRSNQTELRPHILDITNS